MEFILLRPLVGTTSNLMSTIPLPEYVEVDFRGISIKGRGLGGVSLVRTSDTKITFEYLNILIWIVNPARKILFVYIFPMQYIRVLTYSLKNGSTDVGY